MAAAAAAPKIVWLRTHTQEVVTAGLEAGFATLLLDAASAPLVEGWRALGRFSAVAVAADGALADAASGAAVGRLLALASRADLAAAVAAARGGAPLVVAEPAAGEWVQIPAENLVAEFQSLDATLLAVAPDAAAAAALLGALERGVDGVVLATEDAREVRALAAGLRAAAAAAAARLAYDVAAISAVRPVGAGDRACVDLAEALAPGEGLLVGSFARALFLVHAECAESAYIASRPFRVNAGAVHGYAAAPGGRTAYLSELRSGGEALVADAAGRVRAAVVGRVKLEARPLVLVEARVPGEAEAASVLLQNAETVRLVGPAAGGAGGGWRAISVAELAVGDAVYVLRGGGARHTGVAIEERVEER